MSECLDIGKKLVALCNQGKNRDAIEQLYAANVVAIEAEAMPNFPARAEGIAAIRAKNQWWETNHEVHSGKATGPFPHGDRFIVTFNYDITPKTGPMAGKRMKAEEAALYTVKNGKIVQEEFFYHMG